MSLSSSIEAAFGSCDLYAIMDVPRSASDTDIKRAYRKMALRFHPDKQQFVRCPVRCNGTTKYPC